MTERTLHDLTHYSAQVGKMGRLQTLSFIPVLPGDGAEIDLVGSFRLSPLRRGLTMDCKVDICAFYVPHRYIYGDDEWLEFIEDGYDENVTFPHDSIELSSYMGKARIGNVPKWLTQGYVDIWNRYFRPPTTVPEITAPLTNGEDRIWGKTCARLKKNWTTGVNNAITASDYDVTVSGGTVSLLDIAKQEGYLKTELEREFFNIRYADIIKNMGGFTEAGADRRPTMIMRSSFWASGYDVDGTGASTLGQFAGRVSQAFRFKVPRWHVPEHGTIWVVMVPRFPPVHQYEQHYLERQLSASYIDSAGDPAIFETQPPVEMMADDLFQNGGANSLGYAPFGHWYRDQPNSVHYYYAALTGFPFIDTVPSTAQLAVMENPDDHNAMFQSLAQGHWNVQARVNAPFARRLPSARSSILAGTKG